MSSRPKRAAVLVPAAVIFRESSAGVTREIFALGNPAVWWTFLALLPIALFTVARRPTWQEAVAFGGYATMYLPWLAIHRSQFIFYMLPAVPFMCLAVAATLRRLPGGAARIVAPGGRRRRGRRPRCVRARLAGAAGVGLVARTSPVAAHLAPVTGPYRKQKERPGGRSFTLW